MVDVRQPTLGYGSKREAIEALASDGFGTGEIATRLAMPLGQVAAVVSRWRKRRREGGHEPAVRTVQIAVDTLEALRTDAVRRSLSVPELVRRLLDTIADERMVDAVLDDGEDLARTEARHGAA